MVNNSTVEGISNIIAYNSYYVLFLTYVFPILLLVLIVFVIGYLATIYRKLKYIFSTEKSDTRLAAEEQTNSKTLYDPTIIPAIIISVLGIFLILIALIFSFD